MKRKFSILLCILLLLFTCSCRSENNVSSGYNSIPSSTEEITSSDNSESVASEPAVQSEPIEIVPSEPESSTVSEVESVQTSATVNTSLPPLNFTVNDPENQRALSTERKGFSFGVAKDGVAHAQSFANQQTFDSFENVEALALDTQTQEKVMYLTFDNGYEFKNLTGSILDTLKEKNVKAAFFVTLSYVKQNPQFIRRMIDEGHIVGNHSTTHPVFPALNRTQMAQEIATLDNYLRENFSYTSPYFRFPTGAYSECALELVTSIGFRSIFWSIAHTDWDTNAQKGADNAFSTVTSRFHPGAVILLHAVSQDNTEALGRIIDEAHAQGYVFKTLDEYSY